MTARMKDGTVMTRAIIGKKIGMTQVWSDDDRLIPVTVVEAGPCVVSQVKTKKSDGYDAIQIAYGDVRANKVNKPMQGHFAKAGVDPRRYVAEVRLDETPEFKSGDTLTVEMFEVGAKVHVSPPSLSRRHRSGVDPVSRLQRQEDAGPHGRRIRDRAQPGGRPHRSGAEPPSDTGCCPRRQERHSDDS
jgi:large subunit ribosomal protein L3